MTIARQNPLLPDKAFFVGQTAFLSGFGFARQRIILSGKLSFFQCHHTPGRRCGRRQSIPGDARNLGR